MSFKIYTEIDGHGTFYAEWYVSRQVAESAADILRTEYPDARFEVVTCL
jgi:hypothetical protein